MREVREQVLGTAATGGPSEAVDIERRSWPLCGDVADATIDIPRVLVVPIGHVESGFSPFTLDLSTVRYPPVSEDLWIQHSGRERQVLSLATAGIKERRLENYVVRGLVDFDDVSYDEQADLLYDLAGQVVRHFRRYLTEEETDGSSSSTSGRLAANIHAQMHDHYWEKAEGYEVKVSHGFTPLRPSAYTAGARTRCRTTGSSPADKTKIGQLVFGGFSRACIGAEVPVGHGTSLRGDSGARRRALVQASQGISSRSSIAWARRTLSSTFPTSSRRQATELLMVETKARNEMATPEVDAKRKAAEEWCQQPPLMRPPMAASRGDTLWCRTTSWRRTKPWPD